MISSFAEVSVILKPGHQVASGKSEKERHRFPEGTVKPQLPHFKERGLDFDSYFAPNSFVIGTLNLSAEPQTVKVQKPEFFFENVRWTDKLPAENFYLSAAEIVFRGKAFKALLYIPDPATKPDFLQSPSIIEVIAEPIPDLPYGEGLKLRYNPAAIRFDPAVT